MNQTVKTTTKEIIHHKFVKDSSSSNLQEKLKLYENENKILRNQLNENSKISEYERKIIERNQRNK